MSETDAIAWCRSSIEADAAMDAFIEDLQEAAAKHGVYVQRIDLSAFRGRNLFRRSARPDPHG